MGLPVSWNGTSPATSSYCNTQTSQLSQQNFNDLSKMNQIEGKFICPSSQNVPLPDCPTPDSIHGGTESVSSASFPATSPVSQNETDFSSYLPTSRNYFSGIHNQQSSNGPENNLKSPLNTPEKCQNDILNYMASSRQFPSSYFSSDISINSSVSEIKATSSKLKGISNTFISISNQMVIFTD